MTEWSLKSNFEYTEQSDKKIKNQEKFKIKNDVRRTVLMTYKIKEKRQIQEKEMMSKDRPLTELFL